MILPSLFHLASFFYHGLKTFTMVEIDLLPLLGSIPIAIDSDSIEPLSVLRSKLEFEW